MNSEVRLPRISAPGRTARQARHALGAPGLVHCIEHQAVALALAEYRRGWFFRLLVPARHSWLGLLGRRVSVPRAALST